MECLTIYVSKHEEPKHNKMIISWYQSHLILLVILILLSITFVCKYKTSVEGIDSTKHSRFLQYGKNYGHKKFNSTSPSGV